MNDDLEHRIEQYQFFELPGQPMSAHMGTSYLIFDLWKEVRRLRAENAELLEAMQHPSYEVENRLRAELAALKSHTVDCIGLALELEDRARTVESQTTERAMIAAANALRLLAAPKPGEEEC